VHVALLVLPILKIRNGGWIDFDAGRPATEPLSSRSPTPRAGVVNLRCMLYGLAGKPIPPRYAGSCLAQQPPRLQALYNIRDVQTTFTARTAVPSDSVHSAGSMSGMTMPLGGHPERSPTFAWLARIFGSPQQRPTPTPNRLFATFDAKE